MLTLYTSLALGYNTKIQNMRSVWNGSISFGLVSIPIKLFSGSEERALDLDMMDSHDGVRIRFKLMFFISNFFLVV